MTLSHPERWHDIFGFDPSTTDPKDARHRIAAQVRAMCNDLNLRADRRDVVHALRRLENAGKLLEDNFWLRGEL